MCEANAYLVDKSGQESLFLESVDKVVPAEEGIRLVSIFGEQKFIKGKIHSLSLVDHKVFIQPE